MSDNDAKLAGLWEACRKRADAILAANPQRQPLDTQTELAILFRDLDRQVNPER